MYELYKALTAEFLGTFILTFVGAGAVAINVEAGGSIVGNALAFGLTYLVLIYTIGNYSGSNFNPSISFGLAVAGRLGWCRMLLYWIAQFLGAIAAAGLIAWIFGVEFGAGSPVGDLTYSEPWKIIVIEMMLTFFLVFTFLFVTRNPMLALISGFILGLALTANVLFGGYLAKTGSNPAYALATGIFSGNLASFWVYLLGPLLGSLLAVLVYKVMTIPWTCAEVLEKGCGVNCGELPFYEEWKFCTPEFIAKGQQMFEHNKRELQMMGAEGECFTPCDMPKPCEPVCEPVCETKCESPKKRSSRYRQL